MKTSSKLALLAALVIAMAGTTTYSQTESADPAGGQPPGGPPHRPPPLGAVLSQLLDQYDVNHDGQLDQNELAALRKDIDDGKIGPQAGGPRTGGAGGQGPGPVPKEILEKYDVNKDGKLDETERAALHKDIQEGKLQLPALGRGPRGPGGPGFGPPPTAKEILARFDADKDGKLDEAELTAFLQEMSQHRPPRGGRGPGGSPPGEGPPDAPPQQ